MVVFVIDAVDPVRNGPGRHIDLAADDGLDARGLGGLVKIDAAVHNAVVRNGDGILSQLLDPVHELVDPAGAVQQAVFRMDMKVYKSHAQPSFASSISFFSR